MFEHVTPVERLSRTDHIARELERVVLSDSMKDGDRLPSQNELAEQFNVGTRTVREALKNLETKGLVSIQQGRGIFAKKQGLDFYFESITNTFSLELSYNKSILLDLTKTRELIEIFAISQYIANPNLEIVDELETVISEMEAVRKASTLDQYRKLDIKFHQTLVSATGNTVITYLYKHLTNLMLFSIAKTEKLYNFQGFSEHKELIAAMKALDGARATQLIKIHLEHTYQTIEKLKH
ncbi:MAG: FCD domain-containing protein [Sphaerochaeta sp.]|nr:FCD domain-containing protein [Sphaerochaeta sp.]